MNPTSRRIFMRWACLVPLALGAGCQQRSGGGSNMKMPPFGVPLPSPSALAMKIPARPGRPADARRLDRPDFFPPGAQRIGPRNTRSVTLAAETRVKFPSTDFATSPDGNVVLFHDGSKHRGLIIHWLMLLKKTAAKPDGVFNTTTAFDASWSPESQRFAVTNYTGDNSSEVFVAEVDELRQHAIDLRSLIEEHFPEHVWSSPMFVKAYRWTRDGHLVVRSVGRALKEPYDEFGCEALISFGLVGTTPRVEFLNGYVLPDTEP
jgi:hypothetical protein